MTPFIKIFNDRFPSSRRRFLWNYAGLAVGLLAGQVAFLYALWAISNHNTVMVSHAGIGFALLTFLLYLSDWGIAVAGVRYIKTRGNAPSILEVASARLPGLVIAFVIVLAASSFTIGSDSPFLASFFRNVATVPIIWSANSIFLLDAKNRSGISGILQALPCLGYSLPFIYNPELDPAQLASAASVWVIVALLISLFIQILIHRQYYRVLEARLEVCLDLCKDGRDVVLAWLPGQVAARGLLLLGVGLLPAEVGASYVFARQLFNGLSQVNALVRRVDLPLVIERVNGDMGTANRYWIGYARRTLLQGGGLCFLSVFAASVGYFASGADVQKYGFAILLMLLPLLPIVSYAEGVSTTMVALGLFRTNAMILWTYVAISIGASAVLIPILGVVALPIGSLIGLLFRLYMGIVVLKRNGLGVRRKHAIEGKI